MGGDVLPDNFHPLLIHHIGLGDDHHTVPDAQQGQNIQMLHGLGHEALVRRHHQHGKVDAAGTGQHILDEFLVARHVDNAGLRMIVKLDMGKAQLDGNAPLFLLDKAVSVDTGQGLDEHGLAVVHMTGGADDDVLHASPSAAVSAIYSMSSGKMVRTSSSSRPSVMRPMMGFSRQRRACSA